MIKKSHTSTENNTCDHSVIAISVTRASELVLDNPMSVTLGTCGTTEASKDDGGIGMSGIFGVGIEEDVDDDDDDEGVIAEEEMGSLDEWRGGNGAKPALPLASNAAL